MPLLLNRFHQRQQSLHDFQRGGGIARNLDIHRNYLVGAAENGIAVFKYSPAAGVISDAITNPGCGMQIFEKILGRCLFLYRDLTCHLLY
jgi:hypothetical protein